MIKTLLSKTLLISSFSLAATATFAQPGGELTGTTVTGITGVTKTIGDAIRAGKASRVPDNVIIPVRPEPRAPEPTMQNPEAKPVSKYGTLVTSSGTTTTITSSSSAIPAFSNFLAIWGSYATVSGRESPYTPPDNCGDVGATQVIATANCRMKVFAKPSVTGTASTTPTGTSTTTLTPVVNVDLNAFFANSALGISGISDPHVRYDRLSGRWFIVAIDIDHNTNNYCCVAVSAPGDITASSAFKIYYFNISQTGGSSQDFFDYPTLGVDKYSLYIGGNMFKAGRNFSGCNLWVVNKAGLLAASPSLTVTGFPHAKTSTNMYTPQGVHNDDPAATYGYFIGASQTAYSKLVIKRVSYSSGTPTLSTDLAINTATTYTPKTVPTLGGTAIDGGDRRLYAAMIKKNKITGTANLWVAQGTLLNSSGVGGSSGDRDGAYWMEIGNLATTPTILQSATLYDGVNGSSSAVNFTYPSIALSGQGHNLMGFTSAGATKYAQAATAQRFRSDAVATMLSPVDFTNTTSTYNPGANRWGDYTQTVVDPVDDMTMWTFSEYVATTNSWGVRAAQFKAPPPATPSIDASTPPGCGVTHVIINGQSVSNSEFFDPGPDAGGPGFNHLKVSVTGPTTVTVSNVVFVNPTQVTADFNITNATAGNVYTVAVTNPDGQTATTTFTMSTGCSSSITSARMAVQPETSLQSQVIKAAVYPNPTSSWVTVQITSPQQQKASMEVFDISGRKIKAEALQLMRGLNQKHVSFGGFVSGVYILQIRDAHNVLQKVKVIKN